LFIKFFLNWKKMLADVGRMQWANYAKLTFLEAAIND
jgi:hypothetical protein